MYERGDKAAACGTRGLFVDRGNVSCCVNNWHGCPRLSRLLTRLATRRARRCATRSQKAAGRRRKYHFRNRPRRTKTSVVFSSIPRLSRCSWLLVSASTGFLFILNSLQYLVPWHDTPAIYIPNARGGRRSYRYHSACMPLHYHIRGRTYICICMHI